MPRPLDAGLRMCTRGEELVGVEEGWAVGEGRLRGWGEGPKPKARQSAI